jgi:DNA replication protein DnaC
MTLEYLHLRLVKPEIYLKIVEDRTNLSSLIITSQLPIKEWHGHLHNPTIADAILDRIIHNSYKINLEGESQRKLKNQK